MCFICRRHHIAEDREKAEMPSFGPAILPEPETPEISTPLEKGISTFKRIHFTYKISLTS